MPLTFQEAIDLLVESPSSYVTLQQLQNLAGQVSVDTDTHRTTTVEGSD